MKILSWQDLSLEELYSIMQLRQEVFVVEQDCPYLDADGKDISAHHLMLHDGAELVGYARLLAPGVSYRDYSSIGRVVNPAHMRGKGVGKVIMQASIDWCIATYPEHNIKISAQCYLDGFYRHLGFIDTGDHYLEDDIPHQAMIYVA